MSDATKLAGCPFCGVALLVNDNPADWNVARYGTHYMHPEDTCHLSGHEVTPSEVKDWNRRAATPITDSLSDAEIDEVLGAEYRRLVLETGYNGGMGGETWDRAAARAIERAVRAAAYIAKGGE